MDERSYTIRTIRDTGQVQKAGNVKQEGQIPEFNTPLVPEGSAPKKIQQNQEVSRPASNDTNRHPSLTKKANKIKHLPQTKQIEQPPPCIYRGEKI